MAIVTRSTSASRESPFAHSSTFARGLAFLWHFIGLLIFSHGLRRLPALANISGIDIESQFGSHYQFLTNLGLWFSRMTTLFALSADLTPSPTGNFLSRTKTFLMALTMPAEVLISMLYWPILLSNPQLLIPPRKVVDPTNPAQFIWETVRLPLVDDLCFHAAPAILLLIDYLAFSPPFEREARPALLAALSTGGYALWVEICNAKNGMYPYPLLGILSTVNRIGLYSVCATVFVLITLSATAAHKVIDAAFGRQWGIILRL